MPRKIKLSMTVPAGAIAQVKIRLLGISPMIWRRLLVPASSTLQEFHGVMQAAMGWEGLHLYMFEIRALHYGSADLSVASPQVTLESFRFRTNAKITYVYDMMARWEHEIRIEDRIDADEGKRYPVCIGGQGTCPPEDCGGSEGYLACRDEAMGLSALEDIDTLAGLLKEIILDGKHGLLDDEDTRSALEDAVDRSRTRQQFLPGGFSRRKVNQRFLQAEHRRLMHQWY